MTHLLSFSILLAVPSPSHGHATDSPRDGAFPLSNSEDAVTKHCRVTPSSRVLTERQFCQEPNMFIFMSLLMAPFVWFSSTWIKVREIPSGTNEYMEQEHELFIPKGSNPFFHLNSSVASDAVTSRILRCALIW
ncbi:hypothetical protein BDR04DRAFT_614819 [Suillus decipiens]|nr:hypothetical protein BDR04DRAFT_614819 [Suillus decipiens]